MNTKRLLFSIVITCFVMIGCKKEIENNNLPLKKEQVALSISGMTCEIGCAKTIQSKLSKKEGVLNAKVVFTDSIATIEYDANRTNKKELIAFVDGIAGGDLYKASESKMTQKIDLKESHECTKTCKEKCEMKEGKTSCKENCQMDCCKNKTAK